MADQGAEGVVTIMHTDVEGSTGLATRLGDVQARRRIDEMKAIVREQVALHHGREIDNPGDGFMLTFPSTRRGVECAIAIQEALAKNESDGVEPVRVRIGLNVGEVIGHDEHPFGAAVNAGARVMAQAKGGQVLVSEMVRQLAGAMPGVTFRDRGRARMKGFDERWRLYEVDWQRRPVSKRVSPPRRTARRRLLLLAALPAAAAVIGVLAAVGRDGASALVVSPNAVAVLDPATNEVVDQVPVGVRPESIAVGSGAVWVANLEDESVSRIDPATRRVVRTIALEAYPSDIAAVAGGIWVAHGPTATVTRIDPLGNTPAAAFPVHGPNFACRDPRASLAIGAGSLWFACWEPNLARVDPAARTAVGLGFDSELLATPTGALPVFSDVAYGLGSIWLTKRAENAITEVDPVSVRPLRSITVGRGPLAVAVGGRSLWVAALDDDAVTRIVVSESGAPAISTIAVGDSPTDVAVGHGSVWVASRDGTVSRIDAERGEVVAVIELGNMPRRIAVGAGVVWVTVQEPESSE